MQAPTAPAAPSSIEYPQAYDVIVIGGGHAGCEAALAAAANAVPTPPTPPTPLEVHARFDTDGQVVAILNELFSMLSEIVFRHNGEINGDELRAKILEILGHYWTPETK